jgi:biopolymer transport protein ExbD
MRRYSSRHGLQTLSELNVTPLLDLAFVLLIIFMITTPLMENSLDLVVPKSTTAKGAVNPAEVFTISIDKNNTYKLNNDLISVVVRPHFELPVQQFVSVMDILQRAGIAKVGVMTLREDKSTAP